MKMPFNKQTSHTPPKPPSKDFLTSNHQPSTSVDNLNRPYEDETISLGATNNHVGVSGRLLHQASASTLRQLYHDTSDSVLIEDNGFAPEWCQATLSNFRD